MASAEDDYVRAVESERREKDRFFRTSPHSPVPHHDRHGMKGLNYYPVSPAHRVRAEFVPHEKPDLVVMQTSDGVTREYLNIGHFEFDLEGERVSLQTYWNEGSPSLFVPFRDATSGKETYGAGRYLDIEWEGPDHEYAVDFNLAYNPYCAYDDAFSCPFPPPQNWLKVPVRAGERNFKET